MKSTWIGVVALSLVASTVVAQDAAAFPADIEGFRFGAPRRGEQTACTQHGGTWTGTDCLLGDGTPEKHFLGYGQTCRGGRICRIAITYTELFAADDRAAWLQRFQQMKTELATRFNATPEYASGQRGCFARVMNGDATCVFDEGMGGVYARIPIAGTNRTRGNVSIGLRWNSMRRSPAIDVQWSNAAAVWEDENVHEGPYPQ